MLPAVLKTVVGPFAGADLYDFIKPCTVKPLCYDFSRENHWLNDKANIAASGAKDSSWTICRREFV